MANRLIALNTAIFPVSQQVLSYPKDTEFGLDAPSANLLFGLRLHLDLGSLVSKQPFHPSQVKRPLKLQDSRHNIRPCRSPPDSSVASFDPLKYSILGNPHQTMPRLYSRRVEQNKSQRGLSPKAII
jgi:hypothetical protein